MGFSDFEQIVKDSTLTRQAVEFVYGQAPLAPFSPNEVEYMPAQREEDASNILDTTFFEDASLSVDELSDRLNATREQLLAKEAKGGIWSTLGNLRVATAIAAAKEFRTLADSGALTEELTVEDITSGLPDSPYGNLRFPRLELDENARLKDTDETYSGDEEAAASLYRGDLLALLIARYKRIEEFMA